MQAKKLYNNLVITCWQGACIKEIYLR